MKPNDFLKRTVSALIPRTNGRVTPFVKGEPQT